MKIQKHLILFLLILIPALVFCADDEKEVSLGGFWSFNYMALVGNDYTDVPYYDTYSNLRLRMRTDICTIVCIWFESLVARTSSCPVWM